MASRLFFINDWLGQMLLDHRIHVDAAVRQFSEEAQGRHTGFRRKHATLGDLSISEHLGNDRGRDAGIDGPGSEAPAFVRKDQTLDGTRNLVAIAAAYHFDPQAVAVVR